MRRIPRLIAAALVVVVFVGSGIAGTNWLPAAGEAVRLGAVTYLVPFLLILYPGMTMNGGAFAIVEAIAAGFALVLAVPALLAGASITGRRSVDVVGLLLIVLLAIWPHPVTPFLALGIFFGARMMGRSFGKVSA